MWKKIQKDHEMNSLLNIYMQKQLLTSRDCFEYWSVDIIEGFKWNFLELTRNELKICVWNEV